MQAFHRAYIPSDMVTLKKKEFHTLCQGNRSANEYLHKFNQLARYGPENVATDEAMQQWFLEELNDYLFVLLIAQDYIDFQQSMNKAIRQEGKHQEMENHKRRMVAQKFNSRGFSKPRLTSSQSPQLVQCPNNPGFRNFTSGGQAQKSTTSLAAELLASIATR